MSDMIERVARALCKTTGSNPDAPIRVQPDGPSIEFVYFWTEYVPEARAAIAAMQSPTGEMIDAMLFGDAYWGVSAIPQLQRAYTRAIESALTNGAESASAKVRHPNAPLVIEEKKS